MQGAPMPLLEQYLTSCWTFSAEGLQQEANRSNSYTSEFAAESADCPDAGSGSGYVSDACAMYVQRPDRFVRCAQLDERSGGA